VIGGWAKTFQLWTTDVFYRTLLTPTSWSPPAPSVLLAAEPLATSPAFPVIPFLGVVVQLGGAALLVSLFALMRRYVLRRGYFTAWLRAWGAMTIAIAALVVRYLVFPPSGQLEHDTNVGTGGLYFVYQTFKLFAIVLFLRGTVMYVSGGQSGVVGRRVLYLCAIVYAAASAVMASHGLNEMVIWQSVVAVPILAYCGLALLRLPQSRRTLGTVATGSVFALLALFWLAYATAFALVLVDGSGVLTRIASVFAGYNSYFDLMLNVTLGYGMVVLVMEDAKREVDDAQAVLRVSHDQMRRAALYDSLTDSLNRRAFAEGVGLEMVRATFGAVVLADLDNLKLVNDHFGHAVGDKLLRRCVDVLRAALRPYDKLYRWGGDEFLLIMPSARAADVRARLESVLSDADVIFGGGREGVPLEVSIGAADYASAEELASAIDRADHAMYEEKIRRKGSAVRNTPQSGIAQISVEALG
jgi:diguanylate cyclase (GGDEF)-like protein